MTLDLRDDPTPPGAPGTRVVLVTGQSGAGKSTVLRILEDLGYATTDNPPLALVAQIAAGMAGDGTSLALGIDVRSIGFAPERVLVLRDELARALGCRTELLFLAADDEVLLRRFTATRRRHPLAGEGGVRDKLAEEAALLAPLRRAADAVIDTTDLRPPQLRQMIETRYGGPAVEGAAGLSVTLLSFAFPAGLPREADMVFDARFLRNPFYDPALAARDGRDAAVADYVRADPDYAAFLNGIESMLALVLPRFVTEGKKYATVAIGCSGGRHRSVTLVEALAPHLGQRIAPGDAAGWSVQVRHRELEAAAGPGGDHNRDKFAAFDSGRPDARR